MLANTGYLIDPESGQVLNDDGSMPGQPFTLAIRPTDSTMVIVGKSVALLLIVGFVVDKIRKG